MTSGSFDALIGELQAGDTIYVGVGPDGPDSGSDIGNDGYSWDFTISLETRAEVDVSIDLGTQRYVGAVSELDRRKFFNFHSGGGSDQQIIDFQNEYDVTLGRQFWGPLPYARQQTGQVGQYPDTPPSSDPTVRPTYQMVQTGHPRDAIRWDTDVQEAADWVTTYYTTVVSEVPRFYEPMNEPFVHAGDSEFQDAPSTEAMRLKMAQLYAAIGEAVDGTPALADMKVVGYASAWPSMELWDFGHWDTRMKMFMDVAGDYMDAFSVHIYDGVNVTGQNNRRVGSNSEAILDLIETYSFAKWGVVKPHALTEFGGIEQGYGSTYSDIRSAQSLRSINHLMFNYLEREDDVLVSVPFITDKSEWFLQPGSCEPYGGALWRLENPDLSSCSGNYVYTWRIHFFDLWKDVQGARGRIETSDPDIQAQLFVDGNKAFVAVNNLADTAHTLNLDFIAGLPGLQNVEVRQMEIPVDSSLQPSYTENIYSFAPDSITLNTGGTAVLVYEFDGPVEFSNTIRSEKYYSAHHLQPITANDSITFNFNGVQTSNEGKAILRMGIGRKHDRSKSPEVRVNGTLVNAPDDWKGYDQANRDDFFGVIEIPFSIELLLDSNTVEVTFPDSGGRISSMILNVEAVETLGIAGFDFGPDGSAVWEDFAGVDDLAYSSATGYGWQATNGHLSFEGNRGNDLTRDKVSIRSGTFLVDVPDGTYSVDVYLGPVRKADAMMIALEGVQDVFSPQSGPNVVRSYTAVVTDGQLTIDFDGLSGLNNRIQIAGIGISDVAGRPGFTGGKHGVAIEPVLDRFWQSTERPEVVQSNQESRINEFAPASYERPSTIPLPGSTDLQTIDNAFAYDDFKFGEDDEASEAGALEEYATVLAGKIGVSVHEVF